MYTLTSTLSPYETTRLNGLRDKMNMIGSKLEHLFLINRDEYFPKSFEMDRYPNLVIAGLLRENHEIPAFGHPIIHVSNIIKVRGVPKVYVFIDARPFYTVRPNGEDHIKNISEYNVLLYRAMVNGVWAVDRDYFHSIRDYVIDCFSAWMTNLLNVAFNPAPYTSTLWKTVLAIYYSSFFVENFPAADDVTTGYIVKTITKINKTPPALTLELLESHGEKILKLFRNQKQYDPRIHKEAHEEFKSPLILLSEVLVEIADNIPVINSLVVYNLVAHAGLTMANSAEINAISLESPSTFIALMRYGSLKGYSAKTALVNTLINIQRSHDINLFNRVVNNINAN